MASLGAWHVTFLRELAGRYVKTVKNIIRYCTDIFVNLFAFSSFLLGVFVILFYSIFSFFLIIFFIFYFTAEQKLACYEIQRRYSNSTKLHINRHNNIQRLISFFFK